MADDLVATPAPGTDNAAVALRRGGVHTTHLDNKAVTTSKLADNAVTSDIIADGSVLTASLADGAVTTAKLADGAASSAKVSLSYGQDDSGGSTTMTTAAQVYDANTCTLTLAAGTWLVSAIFEFTDAGAGATYLTFIRDTSNNYLDSANFVPQSTVAGGNVVATHVCVIVTGAVTIKPSAISTHNGSTLVAARLVAVRIA